MKSTIGVHLWMHWLEIISEQERSAAQARARAVALGSGDAGFAVALSKEMQASMVAISGAANAIDALYGGIKPLVPVPAATVVAWEKNGTARHDRIFETLKLGCRLGSRTNQWPKQFDALYVLRDPVVHHEIKHRPVAPHPTGLTHVSQETADYSIENVQAALDLAFDVILTTLRKPRAPELVKWAEAMPHVPAAVEAYRTL